MEDICTGCLCSGRKLYFISETGFYQLYSQILNEIPVQDMSQVCIRVCWECCALLQKFQLFKAQVKRNYTEMLWNIPPPSIPSRLATREVHNISYPGTFSTDQDTQVKGECIISTDIKTEVDENLEHQEPVTFVNDLQVEGSAEEPLKNSKRKPKHKKPGKNKIKVKKKKKGKALILPAAVQSDGVSDTEYPLEDTFQEDRIEENTKEDCDKNLDVVKKKEVVKKLLKVTAKVPKSSIHVPVLRLPKAESIPKTPSAELLPKTPSAEVLPKNPPAELLMEKPQCVECGKTFSSRKTYRYHLNVLHKGNNRYPCPRCGKIYQWKSNLGRHMRTHKAVDAGELYCDTCDKSFASVATYRQHLRISRRHVSENEFSFTCNDCGKKFVNKTRLRDHIDWEHLKKIKFRCQLCNKPFKCHTSLYVHLQNVHRNKEKKDNLCHVCGKSYQNAAKLKYHIIALHTGETPYQCSQCSAAFGWYSSLYRHVREVHYKVKAQPKKTKKDKKLENDPPIYMNYQT